MRIFRQDRESTPPPAELSVGSYCTLSFLSLLWWALCGLETCLAFWAPMHVVSEGRLSLTARFTLLSAEFSALALFVLLVFGLVAIWLTRTWETPPKFPMLLVSLMLPAVILWVVFAFVAVSWGVFRTTGGFLDLGVVQLWRANPEQMLQHVIQTEGSRLIVAIVMVSLTTIGFCFLPAWLRSRSPSWGQRRLILGTISVLALSTTFAIVGYSIFADLPHPVANPSTGATISIGKIYSVAAEDRTGPFLHVFSSLSRHARFKKSAEQSAEVRIIRRQQISLDDYKRGIDDSKVHPYNVIVILMESLRPDQLTSFGGRRPVMPALDDFAFSSLRFSKAYCQANNSFAGDPCAVSGQYPVRSRGMHIYPAKPPYPRVLIWDILKSIGYRTAIISSQNENWGRMIDFFDTGSLDKIFHAESAPESKYVESSDSAFATWVKNTQMAGKLDDRVTIDEAIRWIQESDTPFFCYINLQSSHLPYRVPQGFERPFGPDSIDFTLSFGNYPRDKTPEVKDLYADSLRYMDDQLARLFDYLDSSGLLDNTVIVASGDSGEAFYEHDFSAHANKIYNEVMMVPLILKAPELNSGISVAPSQHIDIPPTILGQLGLPEHPSFQGVDLINDTPSSDRSLYLSVQLPGAQQFGIVRGDFKLIFDVFEQHSYLYDLSRDPAEKHDLSSSLPRLAQALEARLYAWFELQVDYYEDPRRMREEYPPVIADDTQAVIGTSP